MPEPVTRPLPAPHVSAEGRFIALPPGTAYPSGVFLAADAAGVPGEAGGKEKRTFLGVETAPVRGALAAQLGLPEGVGLVVDAVVPASPAVGVIERHDVLVKFDDQQLIEPRQLAVLIRQKQDGDTVKLTLRRAGQEQVVTVKLVVRELPKFSWRFEDRGPFRVPLPTEEGLRHLGSRTREEMAEVVESMREEWPKVRTRIVQTFRGDTDEPDVHTSRIELGHSLILTRDDEGALEVKHADGRRYLVAKDPSGKELFSGPINTPEERAKIPATVLPRLEKLESAHGFLLHPHAPAPEPELRVLGPEGV